MHPTQSWMDRINVAQIEAGRHRWQALDALHAYDLSGNLRRIACPVLAMTSDSKLHPVAEAETWRKQIRQSELAVIPGDGFHAAAVYPDECARAALAFIAKHSTQEH
mgnify:CR=1 FL=1